MSTAIETVFVKQEPEWSGDEDEEKDNLVPDNVNAEHDTKTESNYLEFEQYSTVEVKVEICEEGDYDHKQESVNENNAPTAKQEDSTVIDKDQGTWIEISTVPVEQECLKVKKSDAWSRVNCEKCQKSILQRNLQKHMLVHTKKKTDPQNNTANGKPYTCDTCGRIFYNTISLALHLRIHVKKEYICKVCPQEINLSCSNPRHRKVIFKDKDKKPLPCEYCEKTFITRQRLDDHIRSHTKERPFTCDFCKKSFILRSHLLSHIKTHSVEKPYSCELCEKRFPLKLYLTNHMRIHTGEKPFKCETCERFFASRSNLNKHRKIHRQLKLYTCDICQREFTLKHYIIKHLQSHTGLKPFSCEVCHKCFTSKLHLQRHSWLHTGEKPYCCDICNKRFTRSNNLRDHKLKHAGDVQNV